MKGHWMGPSLLLLTFIVIVFASLGGVASDTPGSVGSSDRDGRRAAFLLLEELGHEPELWRRPPGELPAGPHQLWLAAPPKFAAERKQALAADDPLQVARDIGPAGIPRYAEFMQQGGTLVLPATERVSSFLEDALQLEVEPIRAWERDAPVQLIAGALELNRFETAVGTEVVEHSAGPDLLALEVSVGAGSYILIAEGDYLDNGRIGEGDNGLLLAYLAGLRSEGARVLFDEHALGLAGGRSSTGLAVSPSGLLLTLHLVLLLLVVCWRAAWVREFPRDPAALESVSPLARARSLAGVLQRAGRVEMLAGMLRAGDGRRSHEPPSGAPAKGPTTLAGLASLDARLRTREHAVDGDGNH